MRGEPGRLAGFGPQRQSDLLEHLETRQPTVLARSPRILPCSAITLRSVTVLASIAVARSNAVLPADEAIRPAMVAGALRRGGGRGGAPAGRSSDQATAPAKNQDPRLEAERLGDYRSASRVSGQTPRSSSSPLIALTSHVSVGSAVLVWTLT